MLYLQRQLETVLLNLDHIFSRVGFPSGSVVTNLPANAGDTGDEGSIPGSGRYPEGGNGSLLQYSCLGNPMTEDPGGLLFLGLQGVRHDLETKQ